ncbi:MAG: hypothetical protein ACR2FY_00870 [Pirellulaceae bacterium]
MPSDLLDQKKTLSGENASTPPSQRTWLRLAFLMVAAGVSFALFGLVLLLLSQLSTDFRLAFKGLGGGGEFIAIGNLFIIVGALCLFVRWLLRPIYIR